MPDPMPPRPGTPFTADRAYQDGWRNAAPRVENGYSNLASMQPKTCGHCETCRRPIDPAAPGGYCRDCYRTMQFFAKDSTGGEKPGAGACEVYETPPIATSNGQLVDNTSKRRD